MSQNVDYSAEIGQAAQLLAQNRFVIAFTGAGLSTRSGIPDFRSPDTGLWARIDLNRRDEPRVTSIQGFALNPQAFYNGFSPLVEKIFAAEPNPAHFALAKLENTGFIKTVITQNADLLHQRAGSQRVIEVHGTILEATCIRCYRVVPARPLFLQFFIDGQVPRCRECDGVMKPNVILTGEQLPRIAILAAKQAVRACDVMLVAGTSLPGGPATALVESASAQGTKLIIVNLTPTLLDHKAKVVIHADVVKVLPALLNYLP